MTYANRKKRYDIYIERDDKVHAEALAKAYPDVLEDSSSGNRSKAPNVLEQPKEEKPKTKSKKEK